jgi:phthiodiolone/phenolphthiodiolone dimycocerosates ketoreductase
MVELAIPFWGNRVLPASQIGPFAKMLEQSGAVDYFWAWDVLMGWFPQTTWTVENTSSAQLMSDPDSFFDGFAALGIAAGAAPGIGSFMGGTNAVRNGPAEMFQRMMTLASATERGAVCAIGAGEKYNVSPFGYRRSEGLARLEDHFRLYREYWDCDGPFDFDGNVWKHTAAYLGTVRTHRPRFYAMGAGPRLLDLAAKYADGWAVAVPNAFPRVEDYAAQVKLMKERVEAAGRDPEEFGFLVYAAVLVHEDGDKITGAIANPILRAYSAIEGRFDPEAWRMEGLEPAFPKGWNYALHMIPTDYDHQSVGELLSRVPDAMVEKSFVSGSPAEIGGFLADYVEAGATFVAPGDLLPIALDLEDAAGSVNRLLDICRTLRSLCSPDPS